MRLVGSQVRAADGAGTIDYLRNALEMGHPRPTIRFLES